jgi:hypothetical protein
VSRTYRTVTGRGPERGKKQRKKSEERSRRIDAPSPVKSDRRVLVLGGFVSTVLGIVKSDGDERTILPQ